MTRIIESNMSRLLGLRYKSHPWHGVDIGEEAPEEITCFIEMVSTDTVKYEVDKETGYLKIDRPQKYSSILPALYGFIPQTYCGKQVAVLANEALGREGEIIGDGDPLDICVLTEKNIPHGDILVRARPIGGFRMLDANEADDKIIAVLANDALYGKMTDISQLPRRVVDRLRHYFLTYKDMPDEEASDTAIPQTYGAEEAKRVILASMVDYDESFGLYMGTKVTF